MNKQQVSAGLPVATGFQFKYRKVLLKDRLLAYLYDTVVFWVFRFLIGIGLTVLFVFGKHASSVAGLLAYLMFLFRDGFNGGAGFGKGQQNTMVIKIDDFHECSYGRSFIRNVVSQISAISLGLQFGHVIPFTILFMIVTAVDVWRIIRTEGGRRVGDMIAHTQVVYVDDTVQCEIELEKYQLSQSETESKS